LLDVCADRAAGDLGDHPFHVGPVVSIVPLLGPEDLSLNDMAEIISEVLGKQVRGWG
jgi:uncharacterized protein YbjT (DUF2867 family)